jgi:hypothetical protein
MDPLFIWFRGVFHEHGVLHSKCAMFTPSRKYRVPIYTHPHGDVLNGSPSRSKRSPKMANNPSGKSKKTVSFN